MLGTGLGWLWRIVGSSTLLKALELESGIGGHIVRLLIGAAVSFGLVCGLYWIALPRGARKSMPLVPGTLVAVGLQILVGFGYGVYLQKAGDGGAYQAGLASIGVTLMALYLFCLVLLVGTKVNEMVGEQRKKATRPATSGSRPRSPVRPRGQMVGAAQDMRGPGGRDTEHVPELPSR